MQETANGKIHKLEVTDDTLTSRGGLAFFVKYLEAIGIVGLLLHKFAGIKKSIKGVSVRNLFLQALYFFFDGTSRHLSYFDELQPEEGYQAVVEMPAKQMASSHAMKRFFGAFHIFHAGAFRWVLQELFLWRLQQEKPDMVVMTLDTMVMDNDEALQREGCDPTYKKVKGFQPPAVDLERQDRGCHISAWQAAQQLRPRCGEDGPGHREADPHPLRCLGSDPPSTGRRIFRREEFCAI